jgi:hypothetical protein
MEQTYEGVYIFMNPTFKVYTIIEAKLSHECELTPIDASLTSSQIISVGI